MPKVTEYGSTYTRRRGQFVASVRAGYRFDDGRVLARRREFTSRRSLAVAMRKRREWVKAEDRGRVAASGRETLREFATRWLEENVRLRIPASYRTYRASLLYHALPLLGDYPLNTLRPEHVSRMVSAMQGLAPATILSARRTLHACLNHAVALDLIDRNPASGKVVATPRLSRSEVVPFSMDEVRTILDAIPGTRAEGYATLVAALGLRISEALGLQWDDIDFEHSTLRVNRQLAREEGEWVRPEPKSAAGRRTIALPAFVLDALRLQRERQRFQPPGGLDLVFTSRSGKPLHRRLALRWFKEDVLTPRGLTGDLRKLRHSAASVLHAQGASPREIQHILGHADIRVTMNTYTHLFAEQQQDLAARMDDWHAESASK